MEETEFEYGKVQPGGRVTISVGVATLPDDASEAGEAGRRTADSALYASKRGGRETRSRVTPRAWSSTPAASVVPSLKRRMGETPIVKA